MRNKIFFLLFSFFLAGCSSSSVPKQTCDPYFFKNYTPKKGEIVGIGIAGPNINGPTAQKKSAISKALNEIAYQLGVTINSASILKKEAVNHNKTYSSFSSYSLQSVNGKKVRAKIIKECKALDDNYYVLMKAY